jgi:hypothetical protein
MELPRWIAAVSLSYEDREVKQPQHIACLHVTHEDGRTFYIEYDAAFRAKEALAKELQEIVDLWKPTTNTQSVNVTVLEDGSIEFEDEDVER